MDDRNHNPTKYTASSFHGYGVDFFLLPLASSFIFVWTENQDTELRSIIIPRYSASQTKIEIQAELSCKIMKLRENNPFLFVKIQITLFFIFFAHTLSRVKQKWLFYFTAKQRWHIYIKPSKIKCIKSPTYERVLFGPQLEIYWKFIFLYLIFV